MDALGLRPLWFGDTEKEYFFSSEKGVYHLDTMRLDPVPLSPGEKMRIRVRRGQTVEVLDYPAIQQTDAQPDAAPIRFHGNDATASRSYYAVKPDSDPIGSCPGISVRHPSSDKSNLDNRMSAFGWGREDREWVQELAKNGSDPISSLGYDGPLAPLSKERQNISDYFKEAVAVVTNPAIDREREVEHFSTQTMLGARPPLIPSELEAGNHIRVRCADPIG